MNTILGKKPEDQEELNKQKEKISAVLRDNKTEVPFEKALAISAVGHPLIAFLGWFLFKALIFLLAFLGITLPMFMKPEPKVKDIEFIIVNKPEQKPINKNTKLRSDRNSRAGGKHDPKKRQADPEPVAKQSKPKPPSPPPQKAKKAAKPKPPAPKPKPKAPTPKVPPRPAPQMAYTPPKVKVPNNFSIPVPKVKKPQRTMPNYGRPVTSAPIASPTPSVAPAPIMSAGSNNSSAFRRPRAYSVGGGNPGNPSPGNPDGRPGVDAIKEPDFGPYMRELQRRIKRRWNPPRGNKSKRVVVLFKISRDGRLLALDIEKTSGNQQDDGAAILAVKEAAPFRPLPVEYRGNDIDIQFTFDYNVFGVGGQKY